MKLINGIYYNETLITSAKPSTGYIRFADGEAVHFEQDDFYNLLGIEKPVINIGKVAETVKEAVKEATKKAEKTDKLTKIKPKAKVKATK